MSPGRLSRGGFPARQGCLRALYAPGNESRDDGTARFPGGVEIRWLDPGHPDDGDVAGAVALLDAARAQDAPHLPADPVSRFRADLRHGWDGEPALTAVARDGGRRVLGVLSVWLPQWDNTHLGAVDVTVDPTTRRRGLGRQLFATGVDRVCVDGRRVLHAETLEGTPGPAFLTAMGLNRAAIDVQRRQDLTRLDWEPLAREQEAAERRARDYELVRVAGPLPDDLLGGVAQLTEAINDAPIDDLDLEDEVFTPRRLRSFEAAQDARGRRVYRLLARERSTGALAGHTLVGVDAERPGYGWQYDTSVAREHRGHRLGLLLKLCMLRWLAEVEPQLRRMDTWNAASNAHMIRVNEQLGYRVVATEGEWQRRLD